MNWSDNFEELCKQRGQQKYGTRLLALWKIQSGMTESAVCELLGKTHKTLHKWRKRYKSGRIDTFLCIEKGRGRKPLLSDTHLISKTLDALEMPRDGGRARCQDIVDYLKNKEEDYQTPVLCCSEKDSRQIYCPLQTLSV